MHLQKETYEFLEFLQKNPAIRDQIRAAPGKTLLYAGTTSAQSVFGQFFKPMWQKIAELKRKYPQARDKETLHDVLSRIPVPGKLFANLLLYVQYLEDTARVPAKPDLFTVWRALSGIFAANAVGAVSFQVGSDVNADEKVFAATEVYVLARNPNVNAATRDLLDYYLRCVKNKKADINTGFISA